MSNSGQLYQPHDQFILFGDSITQQATAPDSGFVFQAELQDEEYKENLKQFIQHPAVLAQGTKILVLTPPAVNEYQMDAGDGTPLKRTAVNTKLYADAAREVASSLGTPVADIWTTFMTTAGWKEGETPLPGSKEIPNNVQLQTLLSDGLHLTAEGYRTVFDVVMQAIRTNWPELSPESFPWVFPTWTEAPKY
ncbi:hypothetical protein FE257_000831 [Aspergillus nanangensis]|uniref:SGNH hydrolase-type esterase domain-containing protein n=1 Tax=Aspergillus nanangensis TaxID=2582783 RepID=A0AAD4CEX0_ASPNN|nr:hypothetical protein FE257_000831 [Aspergillus nanangensis]